MKLAPVVAIGLMALVLPAAARPASAAAPDAGPEVALRLGIGLPFGETQSGDNLDSTISSTVPLIFEGGYRIDSNLFLGAFFQYGFVNTKNCPQNLSCGGSDVELGAELLYRFVPESVFAPWLGFGLGYEWLSEDASGPNGNTGAEVTLKGFPVPLIHLELGGDVRVTQQLALGPFVEAEFGRFQSATTTVTFGGVTMTTDADITNTAWHTWVAFGVRGAFGF